MTPGLTLGTLHSSGVGINKTKQHSDSEPPVTPGLTLGTLYSSGVGTNKAKQHTRNPPRARTQPEAGRTSTQAQAQAAGAGPDHSRLSNTQAQVLHLNHADPGPGRAGGR